jgi:uroporphyrinogen decarboxylase
MNARENVRNLLQGRPFERAGFHDHVWEDALTRWIGEGYPAHNGQPVEVGDHFGFDIVMFGGIDPMPWRGHNEVVEETASWIIRRNGAGAVLKFWKGKSGAPEHVGFDLTSRKVWESKYRPHLLGVDRSRLAFDALRLACEKARQGDLFLCCHNTFLWENLRNMLGDVCMLENMRLDPGWIHDYNRVYTDFYKAHYQVLFEEIGWPDGMSLSEDLAYNKGLLCSPRLLEELFLPYWAELIEFFHAHGRPVTIHSDGNVTEALPVILEAGFNAINPMEAKAGCEALAMAERYGDRLAFKGGLDVRVLESSDRDRIRREVVRLVEGMKSRGVGYIFGSDHSVSANVAYRDYEYAVSVYREHRDY